MALALYGRGVLSSGNAAALAGMTRWQWEELLGEREDSAPLYRRRPRHRQCLWIVTVSNSSPLIHLSQIGRIDLLRCFSSIMVPSAVWREVVEEGDMRPGVKEIRKLHDEGVIIYHRTIQFRPRPAFRAGSSQR
ncbi:MAG TPA: UPF0175 family protein [Methanolinea sp.]|nr:UPF0175 family protein [Methanolinea sp.]